MREKCPVLEMHQHTDDLGGVIDIPEICLRQCEPLWAEAMAGTGHDDNFNLKHPKGSKGDEVDCIHDVEYSGQNLQRVGGKKSSKRAYGIVYACMVTGEEAFATDVTFNCPNN